MCLCTPVRITGPSALCCFNSARASYPSPPGAWPAEKDKKRALNYRHYTGREWGNVHNYDLSLDSGRLTPEGCVKIITRVVQEKNK